MVRENIKPNHGITKEHDPRWSSEKYKVIRVEDNSYLLDHPTKLKKDFPTARIVKGLI